MSVAVLPFWQSFRARSATNETARTDPPRSPPRQPVFIYDAVTPWRGETLLSHALRADLEAAMRDTDASD